VQIVPTSVIKDGGQVYQPDVAYDVDEEVGRRFVILGWATSPDYAADGTPAGADAEIAPASVSHSTQVTEG